MVDDFVDMFDDLEEGVVILYMYYLKYWDLCFDLINLYEFYWIVIFYLIYSVYDLDVKICEVILDWVINGFKCCREWLGLVKYNEIMDIFVLG